MPGRKIGRWPICRLSRPGFLILDADESVTPQLKEEILEVASRPVQNVREAGFFLNRVTIFMGREIHHCAYFPAWNLRLFKRGEARYEERNVHEHMIVQGRPGISGICSFTRIGAGWSISSPSTIGIRRWKRWKSMGIVRDGRDCGGSERSRSAAAVHQILRGSEAGIAVVFSVCLHVFPPRRDPGSPPWTDAMSFDQHV